MMTPDKDFGQLVSENIFMYKPARMGNKAETWGVYEVCERFGIADPLQVIDILGLWGDASDNIPGVPGIGEKTATKLIYEYDSIENLLKNTDKLKGKQKENLENFADQALMSKELATIMLDVPIEFNAVDLELSEPNVGELKKLFDELEFNTFAKRFFKDIEEEQPVAEEGGQGGQQDLFSKIEEKKNNDISNTDHNYILINDKDEAEKLAQILIKEKAICFDTETTGLDPNNSELIGISFSIKKHHGWYISLPENYQEAVGLVSVFREILESPDILKIGQNIKYDINILSWYEINVVGPFFDTMIAHYLIQPDMRHNMDLLAETYLNYSPVSIESLIGKKGRNQLSMRSVDVEKVKEYATEDADITLQLKEYFAPELEKTSTKELFETMEMPLVPVLAHMERQGVKLDVKALNDISDKLGNEIVDIEKNIYSLAGKKFNIASPKTTWRSAF